MIASASPEATPGSSATQWTVVSNSIPKGVSNPSISRATRPRRSRDSWLERSDAKLDQRGAPAGGDTDGDTPEFDPAEEIRAAIALINDWRSQKSAEAGERPRSEADRLTIAGQQLNVAGRPIALPAVHDDGPLTRL